MLARGPFVCREVLPLADAASLFISLPSEDLWVVSSLCLLPNLGSFQQLFLEIFSTLPPASSPPRTRTTQAFHLTLFPRRSVKLCAFFPPFFKLNFLIEIPFT